MNNKCLSYGFTLIELMMTLVIFGVLVGIAIPSFDLIMRRQELVSQLSKVNSTLAYARSEAIARISTVVICPSSDGATCLAGSDWDNGWLVFVDSNDDGDPTGETILRVEDGMNGEVTLRAAAAGAIEFNENGASASTHTFRLCGSHAQAANDTDQSSTINISNVGSSRVSKGTTECP